MTQYARPASDITIGNWTDEGTSFNDGNLYTSVQEVTSDNDVSYINADDTATTCEVKLSSVSTPGAGSVILHVYFRTSGSGGPEKLDIDLVEGTTVLESWANQTNRSASYADLNATISSSPSDWTDLRVRLGADSVGSGEYIRVTQIYLETPDGAGTNVSDNTAAYAHGGDNTLDSQTAYLHGAVNTLDTQPSYTHGGDSATDTQSAYLKGQDNTLDNQTAYLKGQDTAIDSTSAYLAGPASTNPSVSWAFVSIPESEPLSASDSTPAYLYGSQNTSGNTPAYAVGQDTTSDTQYAFTAGQLSTSDSQPAYLSGSANVTDYYLAYLRGQDTTSDSQPAYTAGTLGASSSTPAYLHSPGKTTPAYLTGQVEVLDSTPAYTKGGTAGSDSTPAYLIGQANALDSTPAYAEGYTAYVEDTTPAYILGSYFLVGRRDAYLEGYIPPLPAYLHGADTPTDSTPAHTHGQDNTSDSTSAYLFAGNTSNDSTPAFCNGLQATRSSYIHAFLTSESTNSTPAYLLGSATSVNYTTIETAEGVQYRFRILAQGPIDDILSKADQPIPTVGGGRDFSASHIYRRFEPVIKVRHTEPESAYATLSDLQTLYSTNSVYMWYDHFGNNYMVKLLGNLKQSMLTQVVEGENAWYIIRLTMLEVQNA